MSLRLQMLQVARLASRMLGDSTPLVRDYLLRQFAEGAGAVDRAGRPDLYYSIFALAGLEAVDAPIRETDPRFPALAAWVQSFGTGDALDFIHLGALARCRAALDIPGAYPFDDRPTEGISEHTVTGSAGILPAVSRVLRDTSHVTFSRVQNTYPGETGAILAGIERHRTPDGGYHDTLGAPYGHAYGCFVALGAYQDAGVALPDPLRMVQCLKFLETPDGAWGNVRGMREGTVPATAAAVTLLHQLGLPLNVTAGHWLLAQQHESGGWLAVPGAPIPDLLSTATALHALSCLDVRLPEPAREQCLDFVDTLWNADGGFHGHWADDPIDAEYTFYGLLALGHLALGEK